MSVVWAVSPTADKDVSAAQAFGELRYIGTRYTYGDEITDEQLPEETWKRLAHAAEAFDPGNDYLLLVGDHLQLVAFMARLANRWHGYGFRVLRWDRKAKGYLVCHI